MAMNKFASGSYYIGFLPYARCRSTIYGIGEGGSMGGQATQANPGFGRTPLLLVAVQVLVPKCRASIS